LKIQNEHTEVVIHRSTDNTMTKRTNNEQQNITQKA